MEPRHPLDRALGEYQEFLENQGHKNAGELNRNSKIKSMLVGISVGILFWAIALQNIEYDDSRSTQRIENTSRIQQYAAPILTLAGCLGGIALGFAMTIRKRKSLINSLESELVNRITYELDTIPKEIANEIFSRYDYNVRASYNESKGKHRVP